MRDFVEFLLMEGDLDMATFSGGSRMLEGTRMHQRLQKMRPAEYESEVNVKTTVKTDEVILLLRGRIDGVFTQQKVLEEIKSSTRPLADLQAHQPAVHWGQACVYGYLYATDQQWSDITIRLTYAHLDTKETIAIDRHFSIDELHACFHKLVADYLAWATVLAQWSQRRKASIEALEFPFESYRKGQREMAVAVYRAVVDGTQLLAQAPTGIGKTMATLFPAIKATMRMEKSRIFYFTARTTGKQLAESTLDLLRNRGLRSKQLTLTAKEKLCFLPDASCTAEECPYAKGYFDRLRSATEECFELDVWNRDCIVEVAQKHTLCPFEFSLNMALWADVIIGDYNYGFDPRVRLKRFFADADQAAKENNIFLVDEAHNMVDRGREMFSATLSKRDILDVRRPLKGHLKKIYTLLGNINSLLLDARNAAKIRGDEYRENALPEKIIELLQRFLAECDTWLSRNIKTPFRADLLEFYFTALRFLRTSERFGDHYTTLYLRDKTELTIRLFCLHPAPEIRNVLACTRSVVFFSATLSPMNYYADCLGCDATATKLRFSSPFPAENLLPILDARLSTRYKDRSSTAQSIARMVSQFITAHRGNYLLFFPSYAYLRQITELVIPQHPQIRWQVQESGMSEKERQTFLDGFSTDSQNTIVGCAVMGGVFGEGIDLVGDRLTGAVIVGVGLPGISFSRNCIRDYYDARGNGFDYAYRFPGFTRVLQAVGRVIRTEEDRGAVLLIDDRLGSYRYRNLIPFYWKTKRLTAQQQVQPLLEQFWKETEDV